MKRDTQANSFEAQIAALYDRLLMRARFFYPHSRDNTYDLVNDTILKALENRDKFDGENLMAWSCMIMRNIFINDYRAFIRRGVDIGGDSEGGADFSRIDLFGTDADDYSRTLDVKDAINSLPDSLRVPLNYLFTGYKYEEIAKILGLPMGTVKSRINIARGRLTKVLTR